MHALMQNWPLLVSKILTHAESNHPRREIISLLPEGGVFRYDYQGLGVRSRKLAKALLKLGIKEGDRVGTMAWNTHRHVELWFAVSGMGAVAHTINPRLFPEQIGYIVQHASDKILCFDIQFLPLVKALAPHMPSVEHYICMSGPRDLKDDALPGLMHYETLLDQEDDQYNWPTLEENTACGLCYTSGTTGNPKGVLYSHRSTFLHTIMVLSGDALGVKAGEAILPIVPMFHANAWGLPYACAFSGAKMVLNGPHHDPESLHRLIVEEGVTTTAAVPTIWLAFLRYIDEKNLKCGALKHVVIGGAAAPRTMIERLENHYDIRVNHAWGMTELSPLGSVGTQNGDTADLNKKDWLNYQVKQGRAVPCVEMVIKDDAGRLLPRDGKSAGRLMVRGPWVVDEYFREGKSALDTEGWFDTGDVAHIDEYGYMQITDRAKDVIKSGGEWISSIDLENAAVSHPDVAEAAVIGVPHPKWSERPLLILVLKEGKSLSYDQIIAHLTPLVAKWWLPEAMEIVEAIPHTATGKISKKDLRERFKDYHF